MKKGFGAVFALGASFFIVLFSFAALVSASWVGTCNQAGTLKNTFYTNETVYVTSGTITSGAQDVRVYIVESNNTWEDAQRLVDATGTGYRTISTNSGGQIPVTLLWSSPDVGIYDIVADVDTDGKYNSSDDYMNSSTTTGFTLLQAPIPTLTVETGDNNPESHEWDLESDTGHNAMLQLNLSATIEAVKINSISLTATGTGNDKDDITVVYLILDEDGDAEYDQGELFLAYESYLLDDGVITFQITGGHVVALDSAATMLITYAMSTSGQAGSTYKFDVVSISAVGSATSEAASVIGLPIGSALKTISGTAPTTTTTTEPTTTTTTTTVPTDECQTDADCGGITCSNKQKTTYACDYDANMGVNVCTSIIVSVTCCGDADCVEGYYCLNYRCAAEGGLVSWLGGRLGERNYRLTLISIAIVVGLAVAVFLIIKNQKKRHWKSKKEYEKEWERLRGKWEKKK